MLSCFLRKDYEDKLVLAGEESCRASRIGRRQAHSLLQGLSITYVSHSPPWLLLTTYSFSSCKSPSVYWSAISLAQTTGPSLHQLLCPLRGRWFYSWEREILAPPTSAKLGSHPWFSTLSAASSIQRLAVGWLLLSLSRASLRKSNPLRKMLRWFQRQMNRWGVKGWLERAKPAPQQSDFF